MSQRSQPDPDPDAVLDGEARRLGVQLTAPEQAAFRRYRDEILRWSAHTNLTALRDPIRIVREGFLDSLACLPLVPEGPARAIDIGSGAGFPALPLAVVRRDLRFTLVEASRRKANFLRHICRLLDLPGIDVLWCRAETLAAEAGHAGTYALGMARAAASPDRQAELVWPFLRAGGVFLAQVGPSCSAAELMARLPPGRLALAAEMPLPAFLGGPGRHLILLRRL